MCSISARVSIGDLFAETVSCPASGGHRAYELLLLVFPCAKGWRGETGKRSAMHGPHARGLGRQLGAVWFPVIVLFGGIYGGIAGRPEAAALAALRVDRGPVLYKMDFKCLINSCI